MSIIVKQEPALDIPLVAIPVEEEVLPPPASEPVPFCTLCLRECPAFGEFYECNPENSAEFCNSVREMFGIEFKQQTFNICKTCWKMVQMMGDFRGSCLKGQSWMERFEGGLGCVDDWHAEEMVQTIDYLQMVIQDHGKRFEESEYLVTLESIDRIKVQTNDAEEDVLKEVPVENESNYSEEVMKQDASEDENLLQEMSMVQHDDVNDEATDSERSCSPIAQTNKHKSGIEKPNQGIIVNISRREVRDPLLNKVTAFFDNEAKIYRCQICDTNYANGKRLKYHLRSLKHQQKVKELKLSQGILVNISRQEVRDPLLNRVTAFYDNEQKLFRCEICDTNFAMRKCLRIHLGSLKHKLKVRELLKKSANPKDRFKLAPIRPTFRCSICNAMLFKKESLAIHIKTVHSEARFECHYCGYKFKKKEHIQKHLFAQHVNPKQFVCTVCKQSFREARSLKRHMENHGNRPFQCDRCEKGYFREDRLEKHKEKEH